MNSHRPTRRVVQPLSSTSCSTTSSASSGARRDQIATALVCLFAEGHLLLEDVPGTGKTTLAKAIANSMQSTWRRIQFTPDLLPSDVTGGLIYDQSNGTFEFRPGPVFANVVLADEINRASPKTQAAMLEVMEERHVTVDGDAHDVPRPFVVIATQNPIEQEGTYRLPEAQLDRFLLRTALGYPDHDAEVDAVRRVTRRRRPPKDLDAGGLARRHAADDRRRPRRARRRHDPRLHRALVAATRDLDRAAPRRRRRVVRWRSSARPGPWPPRRAGRSSPSTTSRCSHRPPSVTACCSRRMPSSAACTRSTSSTDVLDRIETPAPVRSASTVRTR